MRFAVKWPSKKGETRIILILQAEKAYWYKVIHDQLVDSHEEFLTNDGVDPLAACPWPASEDDREPVLVELVLDTMLDEVDRVSVKQSGSDFVNRYRKYMTLARLRRDYQHASVIALPEDVGGSVAALMHHAIPEQWITWLLRLQSNKLVFHQVATGSELAAYRARCFPDRILLVMGVAGYERHMLVQSGSVLFLRTVPVKMRDVGVFDTDIETNIKLIQPAIRQSLEYLFSVLSLDTSTIAIVKPHFSFPSMAVGLGGRTPEEPNNIGDEKQVSVLLAMLLGLDVDYQTTWMHGDDGFVKGRRLPSSLRQCHSRTKATLTWHKLFEFLLIKQGRGARRWVLRRSALRWVSALDPSVRYLRVSRRNAFAHKVSMVIAFGAVITAVSALFNGVVSERHMQSQHVFQAGVRSAEKDIYTAAAAIVQQPEVVADSLTLAAELSASVVVSAEALLEEIATVFTALSGVQLERLVWMIVRRDNPYESLTHSLGSVPQRQAIDVGRHELALQLEVSGRLVGETLNEQQTLLKRFVFALRKMPGVFNVRVLDSPLDVALSSDFDASLAGQYRVSLMLGKH